MKIMSVFLNNFNMELNSKQFFDEAYRHTFPFYFDFPEEHSSRKKWRYYYQIFIYKREKR